MDKAILADQLAKTIERKWLEIFQDNASHYSLPIHLLLAVASRETNIENILGDFDPQTKKPHGFSIFQIDNRSYPLWCQGDAWRDPVRAIGKGAAVLDSKLKSVKAWQGRVAVIHKGKTKFIVPKGIAPDILFHCGVSAYNCGELNALYGYYLKADPDRFTAHGNYGKDVLERAAIFEELLKEAKNDQR